MAKAEAKEPDLVSMMRTPEDKRKDAGEAAPITSIAPDYPYGLCVHLDKDELDKLGITDLPKVGTKLNLEAAVVVTSVRQSAAMAMGQDPDESVSIDLQITDLYVGE